MDTFQRQINGILKEFCSKNRSEIVIVLHNLNNKFEPLDLTVNKAANNLILNRHKEWFSDQIVWQLKSVNDPTDIKLSLKLSDLKSIHASWIVDLYKHMQGDELTLKALKRLVSTRLSMMLKKFLKEWKICSEHKNSLLKVV